MIPLDLPPKLWTPPALILPGQAETVDRALARAGVPRALRRAIEREIACGPGVRSRDVLARAGRDADEASMPVLLALLATRRRGAGGKTIAFIDSYADPTDATTYTIQSPAWGDEAADRRFLLAGGGGNSTVLLDNAVIGGVSATILGQQQAGNATAFMAIAHLPANPAGGSDDIEITWSGGQDRSGFALWRLTGLSSDAAVDFGGDDQINASIALTTVDGGVAAAYAYNNNTTGFTWTNVTEGFDEAVELTVQHSGADVGGLTAAGLVVQVTHGGSNANRPTVAVSF